MSCALVLGHVSRVLCRPSRPDTRRPRGAIDTCAPRVDINSSRDMVGASAMVAALASFAAPMEPVTGPGFCGGAQVAPFYPSDEELRSLRILHANALPSNFDATARASRYAFDVIIDNPSDRGPSKESPIARLQRLWPALAVGSSEKCTSELHRIFV